MELINKPKVAYAMLMMCNDGYLPGVLVTAYSLIKTQTLADIVIMITPDVSSLSLVLRDRGCRSLLDWESLDGIGGRSPSG